MASSVKQPVDDDDWSDQETPPVDEKPKTTESDGPPQKPCEPQPEDSEMVIKPHCECQNCKHWTTSADWIARPNLEFEEGQEKKVVTEKNNQPLIKSKKFPGTVPKIVSNCNNKQLSRTEKQLALKILVHSAVSIPHPVERLSETYFHADIQKILQKINYNVSFPIQSFAWPALHRQLNVFMIGSSKSGKTIAYLPPICTFAFHLEERYKNLSKHRGPLILIICPNSKKCEEIYDLCVLFFRDTLVKPKIAIATYPVFPNKNTVDILITLPETAVHCLERGIFNLKKLCHLVLEDASELLANSEESVHNILDVANQMLEHRPNTTKVQLVVTSEYWNAKMEKLLKSVYSTPLVCIENHLEAALYGNIVFEMKFLDSSQKEAYVEDVLRPNYEIYKTVLVCNNDELLDLNKYLVRNGIKTMALSDSASKEDIDEIEILWNTSQGGRHKVLVCTDMILEAHLTINDAMWLINYSFPDFWSTFTNRFCALLSNLSSPLACNDNEERIKCKSFIICDERDKSKMPKIYTFMKRLTNNFPSNYKEYGDNIREKQEQEKLMENVQLCPTLKLFGKCPNQWLCKNRHVLSQAVDVSNDLPQNGKVVFKILNVKNANEFTVQLIRHIDLEGNRNEINDDDLKTNLIYPPNFKPKLAENIRVDKFYAYCDHTTEGKFYKLCRVVKIVDVRDVDVMLTTGLPLLARKSSMFEPPPNLKIVDIFVCNLVPPFKDEHFSGKSFFVTRESLERIDYKKKVLTGDIFLQLDNNLWLDNIVEIIDVANTKAFKFNLTKHLKQIKVVEVSKNQMEALYALCNKCEVILPTYVKKLETTINNVAKPNEVEPQRAFLDDQSINEVIFICAVNPEEFYVRLSKYQDLLEKLEKELQEVVKNEVLDKNVNIAVGKYFLALDPNQNLYSRVVVLQLENDKALCFYVDYGDEAVVPVSDLKILPSRFITKLPFQAIQCHLNGLSPAFGEWDDEATDVLYKYLCEPGSDIYRSLFVKVCHSDKIESIRAKTRYSVLLKDGFGDKNVLINQLIVDCGFATTLFGKLDNFEIPKKVQVDENSSHYSLDEDSETDVSESQEIMELLEEDFEVFDDEEFLNMFCPSNLRVFHNAVLEELAEAKQTREEEARQETNALTASSSTATVQGQVTGVKKSNTLTPEVFWSQKEDKIKIRIVLIGVEEYKANIIRNKIFNFSTNLEGKVYDLKFTLCHPATMGTHRAKGREVEIVLNKLESTEWSQLTASSKRVRNIHYELPDHEVEEPKKKFLELGLSDEEEDSDKDERIFYHVESDLDSEFDGEAVSSDDNN